MIPLAKLRNDGAFVAVPDAALLLFQVHVATLAHPCMRRSDKQIGLTLGQQWRRKLCLSGNFFFFSGKYGHMN